MAAISSARSSSDAQTQLVKYQQKLAADLAAKAADKVITEDKVAVAKAKQAVQQAEQTSTASIGKPPSTVKAVDVTV